MSHRLTLAVALAVGASNTAWWVFLMVASVGHRFTVTLNFNAYREFFPETAAMLAFLTLMLTALGVLWIQPISEPEARDLRKERAARTPSLHAAPARAVAGKLRPEFTPYTEDV